MPRAKLSLGNIAWRTMRLLRLNSLPTFQRFALEVLGIDIVRGCQLRCIGCPNSVLQPTVKHMEPDVFRQCLENIDVLHVRRLRLFNYGEPLLHRNVPSLLRMIPKQKWSVSRTSISSNAQYHDFDMLAQIFKTGLLDRLVVSCDGDGTPADYERLRPPGKWDKLLEFLARARELRDAHSPHTLLKTVTICETKEGRRRWTEILVPLGWKPGFRKRLSLPGASYSPSRGVEKQRRGMCPFAKPSFLFVDYDGSVVACCCHPRAFVLGNLTQSKYSQIIKGKRRKAFVHLMETDRSKLPVCSKCTL